jgi:hypothetical protein
VQANQSQEITNYNLTKPLKDAHRWIVDYVQATHHKSVAEVTVVGIDGYKPGGGGLYCKQDESDQTFNAMKEAAVRSGAAPEKITKGNFLLVRSNCMKPAEKLACCFIMWHEFGHALADRGVGSNAGEKSAWKFELEAITSAVQNSGLPAGITHDMVRAFIDIRKTNYPLSETDFSNLVNGIETALNARASALTQPYLLVTKEIAINNLGQFDGSRFELGIKRAWPHYASFSDGEKRLIREVTGSSWRL